NDINSFYGSNVQYERATGENLPFAEASFHVVTCVSVLEHVPPGNDRLLMWEAARVLKPGGRLIVTFDVAPVRPPSEGETPWPDHLPRFEQPFTVKSIRRILESLGGYFLVSPNDSLVGLEQLPWDDVHDFWRAAQVHDEREEPIREYLAIGRVFERL